MTLTKEYIEQSMKSIQQAMINNHNQGQKLSGKLDACAYMLKQLEVKEPTKDETKKVERVSPSK